MKKGLKIGLIVGGSVLVAGGARAGLTKAGIIPNRFDIELLCPKSFGVSVFEIKKYDNEIKKYDRCIEKCGSYNIDLSGFSLEGYNDRYNSKFESGDKRNISVLTLYNDSKEKYYSLIEKEFYQERVDEVFYDYKDKVYDIELQINQIHSCKKSCGFDPRNALSYKPIIYLYPTTETKVNVKLGSPKNLSHTYPKYNSEKGRNVIAEPNGDLEDIDNGRKLYALYWEGKSNIETNFDEGFVVAGKDIIPFLEEKLAILGLNEREAEEFIVYRLPQMENNTYNLIRFETEEEQNENMPLNITPKPDTVIRVMMDWKAIDEPIDIPEQNLTTPERNGFTVVEWGGSPRN